MVASILEIAISRNPSCDNLVGFPKSGHNWLWVFGNQPSLMTIIHSSSIATIKSPISEYFNNSIQCIHIAS